jgi:hypothetical protein
MQLFRPIAHCALLGLLSGCAFLHRYQLQSVDGRIQQSSTRRFEFLVSQTGIDLVEGAKWVSVIARDARTQNNANDAATIIALFQMGPRTGNPVYSTRFADELGQKLHHMCKNNEITGLTFTRETNKYPVVSGELVKVAGYCLSSAAPAKRKP